MNHLVKNGRLNPNWVSTNLPQHNFPADHSEEGQRPLSGWPCNRCRRAQEEWDKLRCASQGDSTNICIGDTVLCHFVCKTIYC